MHTYTADIRWTCDNINDFTSKRYSRAHTWGFDGGVIVPASSSPNSVRVPYSNPASVDPEEAFVAALSSCHMLTFLYLASVDGYAVAAYADSASGIMEKIANGKEAVTQVTLRPQIVFSGDKVPTDAVLDDLHHRAHEDCYLANSVKTVIAVQGHWQHSVDALHADEKSSI